jgi:hypothetical protein
VIAAELGVDEATVRRDLRFLAVPVEERRVTPPKKPPSERPLRTLSPDKLRKRRMKELLKVSQSWIVAQTAVLSDVEYILDKTGKLLYGYAHALRNIPISPSSPSELLARARPKKAAEDDVSGLEFLGDWLARWLVLCLPGEEELQDDVLRETSIWARSPQHRFVY